MEKKIIKTWGVALILFLAVFTGCILTTFSKYKVVTDYGDARVTEVLGAASPLGLKLMGETWIESPDYFIGIAIIAFIALIGAGWSVHMMNKAGKEE